MTHDQTEAMTLADKIVVLRTGKIEQVGNPMDLNNDPDITFAAGFIGSPRMNILKVVVAASRLKLGDVVARCRSFPQGAAPARRRNRASGLTLTESCFGCAGIADMYQKIPEDRAMATLEAAKDVDIRYFDTGSYYGTGLPEQRLCKFLAGKPRANGAVSPKAGRLLAPVAPGMTLH